MIEPEVVSASSRAILTACEALGIDTGALLDAAGLDRATVEDPDGRIPVSRLAALWTEAERQTGEPLAFRAAEIVPFGVYKVVEYLAWSSATVGEGISRMARYLPLLSPPIQLRILEGEPVVARLEQPAGAPAVPFSYIEYALAVIVRRSRQATGESWPLARVALAHAAPADSSEHRGVFGCPVVFGAPHTQIEISRAAWDAPVRSADPELFRVLEDHARRMLVDRPAGGETEAAARDAIARELRGGTPTVHAVARRLGTSARSLQRKLRDRDTTFAALLDDERHRLALAYLGQPDISLWEVGHLLGFAEQSSFQRAFKRWTGRTPSAHREALRSSG